MEKVLHLGWCFVLPLYKLFYRIIKKVRFDFGTYVSYNTRFDGSNSVGQNSYIIASELGYASYISRNGYLYNTKVGKYTCIGPDVAIVCGKHPTTEFVSVHPAFYSKIGIAGLSYVKEQLFKENRYADQNEKYSVVIGNDVWIGANVTILEGVNIGDGAIIAAGALVNRNVDAYTIVAGVPAKGKGLRFESEKIEWLKNFKWWDKSEEWIKANAACFYHIEILMDKYK